MSFLKEPPCLTCKFWNPITVVKPWGQEYTACHAEEQYNDFSCFSPKPLQAELEDGYYWFYSERSSKNAICEYLNGDWYMIDFHGPVTLEYINRRGWQLLKRAEI